MGGVKKGFTHIWKYKTHHYKENHKGRFEQTQTKGRNSPAPYGSGMPTKSKLIWAINGKFYVKRIGKHKWLRITNGYKGQAGFKLPTMKKFKFTKRLRKTFGFTKPHRAHRLSR